MKRNTIFPDIFTNKFFQYDIDVDNRPEVRFPLPTDEDSLRQFQKSAEGKEFRKHSKRITTTLKHWVTDQGWDTEAITQFEETFININASMSSSPTSFELFRLGIPDLLHITVLLENDHIPIIVKQDVIRNLLGGITECGPGACANIMNARLALVAQLNLPNALMKTRKHLTEQAIVSSLERDEYRGRAHEIHRVNDIANKNAKILFITPSPDYYAESDLEPERLSIIQKKIEENMQFFPIISALVSEMSHATLAERINAAGNRQHFDDFEQKVKFYGAEDGLTFFKFDDLLEFDEETFRYRNCWRAPYVLHLSIVRRLETGGYLDPQYMRLKYKNMHLYFLRNHSCIPI